MNYKEYIVSKEWYDLKIDLLEIRGCKCEICGKQKHPTRLQIHHKHYLTLFNENPEDLLILCSTCHKEIHRDKNNKKKRVKPKPITKKNKNSRSLILLKKRVKLGRYKDYRAYKTAKTALKRKI